MSMISTYTVLTPFLVLNLCFLFGTGVSVLRNLVQRAIFSTFTLLPFTYKIYERTLACSHFCVMFEIFAIQIKINIPKHTKLDTLSRFEPFKTI